jgi:hypothetical protein
MRAKKILADNHGVLQPERKYRDRAAYGPEFPESRSIWAWRKWIGGQVSCIHSFCLWLSQVSLMGLETNTDLRREHSNGSGKLLMETKKYRSVASRTERYVHGSYPQSHAKDVRAGSGEESGVHTIFAVENGFIGGADLRRDGTVEVRTAENAQ